MTRNRLFSDIERAVSLYGQAHALVSGITKELLSLTDDGDSVFDAVYSLADGTLQTPEDFLKKALGPGYEDVLNKGAAAAEATVC